MSDQRLASKIFNQAVNELYGSTIHLCYKKAGASLAVTQQVAERTAEKTAKQVNDPVVSCLLSPYRNNSIMATIEREDSPCLDACMAIRYENETTPLCLVDDEESE